jgi:hypothetical protein
MQEGVAGLTRDKTRKPGKPPLPPATVPRVMIWRLVCHRDKLHIGLDECWPRQLA